MPVKLLLTNWMRSGLTKNKGYMPMVGHVSETGKIVSYYFSDGNAALEKETFSSFNNAKTRCQLIALFKCYGSILQVIKPK
jgi:hypothetical protein